MVSLANARSSLARSFRMTSPASAPPEILEHIFRYAAFGALDVPSKSWRLHNFVDNDAKTAIRQVPLVNRHWNEAATRILYWQLDVNECQQRSARNALLARTLEESPRLQAHVRSLYLHVDINDREELEGSSVRILRCCPLVQHLWITGWIPSLLDEVHTTITTFTRLRYLFVRCFSNYRGPFCSFEKLESMMNGWPNLEKLVVGGDVITDDNTVSIQSAPKPPMKKHIPGLFLPSLRSLEGFAHILPNLVELSLGMSVEPDLFLLHVQRWKRTLRCLKFRLTPHTHPTKWQAVMTALCGFEQLHQLTIRHFFPLNVLELPDTLQKVKFMVREVDLPFLFDALDQKLPYSIKTVVFDAEIHDPQFESALRAFCEKRHWKSLVYHPRRYRISTS